MNYKLKHDRKIVYSFVAIALGLFLIFSSMIIVNNKTFKSKTYYYTMLESAHGLATRPPIYFKGYEIGRIVNYELTEENLIRVNLYIYSDFGPKLLEYSVLSKNTSPLTGEISEFEIILPNKNIANIRPIASGDIIYSLSSDTGQSFIKSGKLTIVDDGISGVLRKVNSILDEFVQNKTSNQVDKIIGDFKTILATVNHTIESYNINGLEGKDSHILELLKQTNTTMKYIKETLEVIHQNRKELAPLMIHSNQTLEKARDTLEGINNNPFIKNGIPRGPKKLGVEVNE